MTKKRRIDAGHVTLYEDVESKPHAAHIHLDALRDGRWQLTSMLTHERTFLDAGEYEFVHGAAGGDEFTKLIGLTSRGDEVCTAPIALLNRQISVDADGGYLMYSVVVGSRTADTSLESLLAKFKECDTTLIMGALGSEAVIESYAFARPRSGGCRLFWGLFDIYKTMSLTTYTKMPSRWVNAQLGRWCRHSSTHFEGAFFFIHSKHANIGELSCGASSNRLQHVGAWFSCCQ